MEFILDPDSYLFQVRVCSILINSMLNLQLCRTESLNKYTCCRDKLCCDCCNSWIGAFCTTHRQYASTYS